MTRATTIAESGETTAESGETVAETGETIAESGETTGRDFAALLFDWTPRSIRSLCTTASSRARLCSDGEAPP